MSPYSLKNRKQNSFGISLWPFLGLHLFYLFPSKSLSTINLFLMFSSYLITSYSYFLYAVPFLKYYFRHPLDIQHSLLWIWITCQQEKLNHSELSSLRLHIRFDFCDSSLHSWHLIICVKSTLYSKLLKRKKRLDLHLLVGSCLLNKKYI